jgi:hypothetical protein
MKREAVSHRPVEVLFSHTSPLLAVYTRTACVAGGVSPGTESLQNKSSMLGDEVTFAKDSG